MNTNHNAYYHRLNSAAPPRYRPDAPGDAYDLQDEVILHIAMKVRAKRDGQSGTMPTVAGDSERIAAMQAARKARQATDVQKQRERRRAATEAACAAILAAMEGKGWIGSRELAPLVGMPTMTVANHCRHLHEVGAIARQVGHDRAWVWRLA